MTYSIPARIATALLLFSFGIADAVADVRVFKCPQPGGAVLYTDRTCTGGTALDIPVDPVDPNALARLARAGAALDAAEAQRTAEQARQDELGQLRLRMEAQRDYDPDMSAPHDGNYGYDDAAGYGSFLNHRHRRGARLDDHADRARRQAPSREISASALQHSVPSHK